MVNHLAELVRIRFLSEIAKAARTPNGTYDLAKARAQVKKTYREIALLAHPDRNPGPYRAPSFRTVAWCAWTKSCSGAP